jgi:hypothetical protein
MHRLRPHRAAYYHSQVPSNASALALLLAAALASAQPAPKKAATPLRDQSASTINLTTLADGEQTVEIRNVSYEVSGTNVPGRPGDQRLLLRNTTSSRQVLGDIGMMSTVTLEAWPLGVELRQKSLYSLTVEGADGHLVDNALFVVLRGLEETLWWSAYKLGSGQHLFDTYVPLLSFSISRDTVTTRYVGLDAPSDNPKDARLKQPNVVAIVTYASEDHVIREALLTCDDPRRAALLRSYADTTRTVTLLEDPSQQSRTLRLYLTEDYPSPPNPVEVRIPVQKDDLDLAHAQLPPRMHLSVWRR